MPNRFTPLQTGTDPTQQIAVINNNFAQLDNETVKKLYDDSTGTHRILIDATVPTIKIAKPGYDVTTATNDQLAFNSAQNVFKIVLTGNASIDASSVTAGSNTAATINHNLGFTPGVICYLLNTYVTPNVYAPLPTYYGISASAGKIAFGSWIDCAVDSSNLYINFFTGSAGNFGTLTFKYYLTQETAN